MILGLTGAAAWAAVLLLSGTAPSPCQEEEAITAEYPGTLDNEPLGSLPEMSERLSKPDTRHMHYSDDPS